MERMVARAIITNEEGKALVCKYARGTNANVWALVGGKPDPGELLEETICREVREETNLVFSNPALFKMIEEIDSVPDQKWIIYFFTGKIEGEIILKEDELAESAFVGLQDLDTFDIGFNHRKILKEFFQSQSLEPH